MTVDRRISWGSIATIIAVIISAALIVGADQNRLQQIEQNQAKLADDQRSIQERLQDDYVRFRDLEPVRNDIGEIKEQLKELNSNFNEYLLKQSKDDE